MDSTEKIKKEIGKRIKEKREELNLSQEQLANELGYKSKTSIHKVEQGITDLPQSKIEAFAKILKTTPAYLMGWEKETEIRNRIIHGVEIPANEKLKFIKNIGDYIQSGMTYGDIAKILNFPNIENKMFNMIFEKDLIALAKTDEQIFKLLVDTINSITKKLFKDLNLHFDDSDAEINQETFKQVMNENSMAEVLKEELEKINSENVVKPNATMISSENFVSVPVYGKASAGSGYINIEKIKFYKTIHINGYSRYSFLVEVYGDSMEPLINDGEFVLVDPTNNEITDGKIYVVTYNDETFIKRIEKHENIIILKSINPLYNDKLIQNEQLNFLKIEGRVVKVISERNL